MPEIGQMISHYSIVEKIGKGGMGEVFRAKDQKLGRDVAIKVLPEEFARDADRVARFQREAKLLASLNHSNIASIYGLEESDGTNFLVLELIEGETLADRIKSGPIAVEESLTLALQIAEALEAAHEKGVIHRDLKPANIKITPDGKIKVLDFGLAKAFAGDQEEVNLSNSPTLSDAATQQGVILGTAAYMSPEQARGKSVDKRADIFAFGCVLYEMLAGHPAFSGKDVTDILAAVIRSEPVWNDLPANVHWRLREVLERCLEKEAKDRYGDISDARVDIRKVLADPSGVFAQPISAAKPRKRLQLGLPWIAAIFVLGLILAGAAVWKLRPAEPKQVMRFEYELPEGQEFSDLAYPALAMSPDGKRFAYSTARGLFLHSVDELTSKLIAGTEGSASQPFFSPDGKWIGYLSIEGLKVKKIDINGGAPVALCDALPLGLNWDVDNTIIYGQYSAGDIMRVSSNGGSPEPLIKTRTQLSVLPQMLPDGKSVLYTASVPQPRIVVQSLKSGERKELFAGIAGRYVPTGHIVYGLSNNNNLFAIPFDPDTLELKGGAVPVVEGVISPLHYAISDSGTLVYIPGTSSAAAQSNQRTLVWVDRKGKEEPISAASNDYHAPRISPDGTKVALSIRAGDKSDIWIWDTVRETMTRLTFDGFNGYSLWTSDGQRIAFSKATQAAAFSDSVYWKAADGTGEEEKLGSAPDRMLLPWSWSSDGKALALFEATGITYYDIGILSMEGNHEHKSLLKEKYIEFQPKISPDGKWMAYASNESGQLEIYVRPFPDVNKGRWQVSTSGGDTPLWAPNGRELFYRNAEAVMSVSVETEPAFKAGKPGILFRGTYVPLSISDGQPWDISPDGKRFLMLKPPVSTGGAPAAARKVDIVVNWFEELKRRAPVK
jgi:Tol biopolymer transport system component